VRGGSDVARDRVANPATFNIRDSAAPEKAPGIARPVDRVADRREHEERAGMSDERRDDDQLNEDGPGVNGDLGSWLYVVGGIPLMILFFVVFFSIIGSCDAENIMIHG
jgi:hypothetical protein